MNLGDLRKLLAESKLPDSAPLLVPAHDHCYREADVVQTTAVGVRYNTRHVAWEEDYGMALGIGEVRHEAFVIT